MHITQDHVSNGLKAEKWKGPSYGSTAAFRMFAVITFFSFSALIFKWSAEARVSTALYVIPFVIFGVMLAISLGGSTLLHPVKGYYGQEATRFVSLAVGFLLALGGSLFLVGVAHFFRYQELMAGPGIAGRAADLWRLWEGGAGRAFYLHDGYVALERQVEGRVAPVFASQADMLAGGRIVAWALPVEQCLAAPCERISADSCGLPPDGRGNGGLCGTVHDLGGLARSSGPIGAWADWYDLVGAAAVLDASYANRTAIPGMLFRDPEDQWWHRTTYYAGILILFSYLGVEFFSICSWVFSSGGIDFSKCKQEFDDGSVYHGQFKGTRFVGKGRMTWVSGDEYEGIYLNSKMHGQGVYRHVDGSNYRGQYEEDLRQGYGVFTFTDGTLYEGEWQQDVPHGEGRVIYPNGKVCMAMFKDGQQDIKGMGEKTLAKAGGTKAPTPPPSKPAGTPVLPQSWPGVPAGVATLGLLPAGFPALPPLPGVAAPKAPAGFPNSAGPPRPPGQAPGASMPGLPRPPGVAPPKALTGGMPGSGSLRLPVIAPYAPPPAMRGGGVAPLMPRPPGSKPPPPPPGSGAAHGGRLRLAGRGAETTAQAGQMRAFIPPVPPPPKLAGPRPNPIGVGGHLALPSSGLPGLPPMPRKQ